MSMSSYSTRHSISYQNVSLSRLGSLTISTYKSTSLRIFKTGGKGSKRKSRSESDRPADFEPVRSSSHTSAIGPMLPFLKENLRATDDELNYLQRIVQLRTKKRPPLPPLNSGYSSPSVIIDDFLYHGDLVHASNPKLLNALQIRHIVNVCDCALDQSITSQFRVLWININDEIRSNIRQCFEQTNEFLLDCEIKREKVLVHCQMGISRSSSVVLAFLMKFHDLTIYEAYDNLLERRRMAAPNLSFFLQLIRYENELRNKEQHPNSSQSATNIEIKS